MIKHLSCTLYALLFVVLGASAQNEQSDSLATGAELLAAAEIDETADSVTLLNQRLKPKFLASTFDTNGLTVIDTLATANDAVQVILYSNNTWKYVRNREISKDSTIFEKYWDTSTLFPYKDADMSSMPFSVVIDLVDSLKKIGRAHV